MSRLALVIGHYLETMRDELRFARRSNTPGVAAAAGCRDLEELAALIEPTVEQLRRVQAAHKAFLSLGKLVTWRAEDDPEHTAFAYRLAHIALEELEAGLANAAPSPRGKRLDPEPEVRAA